ncbi:MAG: hypothetical protein AAFY91_10225, partial [Bacteroidota bacterium]
MRFTQPMCVACRALLIPFLLFSSLSLAAQQESLLTMAVELDDLYGQLDSNENAAQEFFDILKKLYGQDGQIDEFVIQSDFGNNQYMAARVQNVFGELGMREDDAAQELDSINGRIDSLLNFAFERVEATCRVASNSLENCDLLQIVEDNLLESNAVALRKVREATTDSKLKDDLLEVEDEYLALERQKTDLENSTESVLLLSADAGGGFNFSPAAEASQAFAPIVIQAPSGGSFQSSLLDGASKWIAERMREELSIAFFDRFKTWIGNGNLDYLFPNTVGAMNISATADYSLLIQILKTAFEQDLSNMPFNMGNYLREELNEAGISDRSRVEMASILSELNSNQLRSNEIVREIDRLEATYYGPEILSDSLNEALSNQLYDLYIESEEVDSVLNQNNDRLATMGENAFKRQ